jgi:hypothetical protein
MTHNNITGDKIATKAPTKAYRDGWDAIFKPKPAQPVVQPGTSEHKPGSNR